MQINQERQVTTLQEFNNSKFGTVRTVQVGNQPYFVGKDVADALGYAKSRNAIDTHVDRDDALKQGVSDKQGVTRITTLINESGVYSLIFGSKLPQAKAFKKWVTSEVLPAIRKTGGYVATTEQDTPEMIMARALQVAQQTIDNHLQRLQMAESERDHYQAEVKILAPKATYTDTVLQSTSTYTMTQVAKEFGMSAHRFGNLLRERKVMFYQSGQWLLTSKYQAKGYTKPRTHHYTARDGSTGTNTITVWTEKGRAFLHNKLGEEVLS